MYKKATAHIPDEKKPASTLLGVTGLADPKMLVEIEATAVIPAPKDPETALAKETVGAGSSGTFSQVVAASSLSGPSTTVLWRRPRSGSSRSSST